MDTRRQNVMSYSPPIIRRQDRRAAFASLVAAVFAIFISIPSHAQRPNTIHRIGVLSPFGGTDLFLETVGIALREKGYVPARDILIEYRAAGGESVRLPGLATELVQANVDMIITTTA